MIGRPAKKLKSFFEKAFTAAGEKMKKSYPQEFLPYLKPTSFIDSDSPAIISFAATHADGAGGDIEKGIKLFYAVRDEIRYDPYNIVLKPEAFRASNILKKGFGYCVAKAIVLAAAARAEGIPSRLGLADVRNHLSTERLRRIMKTDVFVFHGYTELFLDDHWIKVTPTFNRSLCDRFGVKALEFDGRRDSLFHPYDAKGNRHMEYVHDHGAFADVPVERIVEVFRTTYPQFFSESGEVVVGSFDEEAQRERER
jgi:transglutaminase-like putative cysteine protease